jgi:Cu+-exporting ATPase
LILATPAAILAAVARLARQGVVLRGGLAIERLATASALVFDKTGTLTEGRPTLGDVVPMVGHDADLILRTAALAEQRSEHVLAEVIVRAAADRGLPIAAVEAVEALPGAGVRARVGEQTILVGNRRLLEAHGISISPEMAGALSRLDSSGQTALIVVRNAEPIGAIGVRDTVRSEARQTLDELRQMGFEDVALVTGDRWAAAQNVAQQFGITFVRAEQLPADKARIVEEWRRQGKRVAMVGDGINDAPALAVSDVGLALGGVGSNIAAEAGDVILMRDPLRPLPFTVRMARQTLSIIKQDILVFAFGVNATAIVLSAWGMLPPIYAALYHQIGSLLVLLNSMRLLFFERWDELAVVRRLRRLDDAAGQVLDWLNPMTASAAIIAHWRRLARLGAAMMLAGYGLLTLSVIDADEQGVLQRFGKSIGVLEPGLHWHLPPPFDRVHRLRPNQVRVLEIGFRSLPVADPEAFRDLTIEWNSPHREGMIQREENEAVMVTGDESMVDLETLVFYRVADARQFLFGVSDPLAMLRAIAESVLRSQAAHTPEDAILTTGRSRVESQALSMIRARVGPDQCYLGVEVLDVVLRDVHPPLDVVRAYHDVSSAMEEREQIINIAKSYDISTVLAAQSQRDRAARQAEAYQTRTVRNAEGARDAYLLQHESYRLASRLTHERWYWEAVETVLANRPKIVLDPKASRNRRILLGDFGSTMLAPEFAEPAPPAATMPQEH